MSEFVKNVFGWDHLAIYLSGPIDFMDNRGTDWRDEWTNGLVGIGIKQNQIFNPCHKPLYGEAKQTAFNLDNEAKVMQRYRNRKDWKVLCGIVSQIAHMDLRLVDKSDIVLVNFPKYGQEIFEQISSDFNKAYISLSEFVNELKLSNNQIKKYDLIHNKIASSFLSLLREAAEHRVPTYGTIHELVVAHQQRKPIFMVWEGGKETCSGWLMWLIGSNNVFSTFDELKIRLDNISKGKTAYNVKEWLLLEFDRD